MNPRLIPTIPLGVKISAVAHEKLDELAQKKGRRRVQLAQEIWDSAYAAQFEPANTPGVATDARVAALQRALDAIRENYHTLQAEAQDLRSKATADRSGELLELRRRSIEFDAVISRVKHEAAAHIAAAKKDLDQAKADAAKAARDAGNKIGGLTKENTRLKSIADAAPNPSDLAELRAKILELGKAVAGTDVDLTQARAAADRAQAEVVLLQADRKGAREQIVALTAEIECLKARIAEHQEAQLDLVRQIEQARRTEALAPAFEPVVATNEPEPSLHGLKGELAPLWAAINDIRASILQLADRINQLTPKPAAPKPTPSVPTPQEEAEALSGAVVKSIKAFRSAGHFPDAIAKFTGVSVGAVKIIVATAAVAKAKAAAQ